MRLSATSRSLPARWNWCGGRRGRACRPRCSDDWVAACRNINARIGSNAAMGFIRNSPSVAAAARPEAVMALAAFAPDFVGLAGRNAALALFVAAPARGSAVRPPSGFRRMASRHPARRRKRAGIRRPAAGAFGARAPRQPRSAFVRNLGARRHPRRRKRPGTAAEIFRLARYPVAARPRARRRRRRVHRCRARAQSLRRRLVADHPRRSACCRLRVSTRHGGPSFANGAIRVPQSSRGVDGHSGKDLFRATLGSRLGAFPVHRTAPSRWADLSRFRLPWSR